MKREANIIGSIKDLVDTWNAWADCVERIFRQIGDQTKDLEVSDEIYISFVRMFAAHPARPTRRLVYEDHAGQIPRLPPHSLERIR